MYNEKRHLLQGDIKMEDMKYTFETVEDDYKKVWLETAYGEGEVMIIPDGTYGLMPDSLRGCDEPKKIWIPASVKIIAPDVFSIGSAKDSSINRIPKNEQAIDNM
jgi:hypothetical protein